MRTRIVHTHIHFEDDWFNSLSIGYSYLFMYLFTNTHIGQTGAYRLTRRVAMIETGASREEWDGALKRFEEDGKIILVDDWIIVKNASKYANYSGGKNEIAYKKEYESLPKKVQQHIQYRYPMDTTINHKSEIIKHKPEIDEIDIDEADKWIEASMKKESTKN